MHFLAVRHLRKWLDPVGKVAEENPGHHVYYALDRGRLAVPPEDGDAFIAAVLGLVAGRRPVPLCLAEAFDPRLFCLFFDIDWEVGDPNVDPDTGAAVALPTRNPHALINRLLKDLCRRIYLIVSDAMSGIHHSAADARPISDLRALVYTNLWTGKKAGAHIVFPGLMVNVEMALKIRWYVVQHMKRAFPYVHGVFEPNYDDMVDEMVYTHGKSLRLPLMHKAVGDQLSPPGKVYRVADYLAPHGDPRTVDFFRASPKRQLVHALLFPYDVTPADGAVVAQPARPFWAWMRETRDRQPAIVRDGPGAGSGASRASRMIDIPSSMISFLETLHPSLPGKIKEECKLIIVNGTVWCLGVETNAHCLNKPAGHNSARMWVQLNWRGARLRCSCLKKDTQGRPSGVPCPFWAFPGEDKNSKEFWKVTPKIAALVDRYCWTPAKANAAKMSSASASSASASSAPAAAVAAVAPPPGLPMLPPPPPPPKVDPYPKDHPYFTEVLPCGLTQSQMDILSERPPPWEPTRAAAAVPVQPAKRGRNWTNSSAAKRPRK